MIIHKQSFLKFIKYLIPFAVLSGLVQYLIIEISLDVNIYYPTFITYIFLFFMTLLIYTVLLMIDKAFSDKTGFAFIGLGLVKMFFSIIFLLPVILNDSDNNHITLDIFSFFIPYFLFLLFETLFVVKLLRAK
ncbi:MULTISPECIES: hypothetical protein [Psychroflexus]|uniref:ATP synthase protein I n=1 Tax=Psychroflexus halocasei TaxID=908615 RepID=A0A1H3VXM0_9FLAO|nr:MULTISPECIES: hypothetical protein [Psychroflexus]SDZ79431.1 hypothetical protein SAMN05421540_101325 [Psychroflexus halocasei]